MIYRGPWRQVEDDDGHVLHRGVRTAVCDKTFQIYARAPYADHVDVIEPHEAVPLDEARPFACDAPSVRDPRQSKGADYRVTTTPECKPGSCC